MEVAEQVNKLAQEETEKLAHERNTLAAENAKLKKFCKDAAFDADYEAELGMERGGFSDALNEIKTPVTDAFLAEVRARGVEMFAASMKVAGSHEHPYSAMANEFAAQLRKGGNQRARLTIRHCVMRQRKQRGETGTHINHTVAHVVMRSD